MTFSSEQVNASADGGIFNFYCELPIWMEHTDVGVALVEMDASVRAIQEPPIATIHSDYPEPDTISIEDYRRFYVNFESGATTEDMKTALDIVASAIKKYRYTE